MTTTPRTTPERTPRTLPLRLPPVPGEALDSWLEAVAALLRTPIDEVLTATGLHEETTPPPMWAPWLTRLDPAQARHLAAVTVTDVDRLHRMTLATFDQRALVIDHATGQVQRSWRWGRPSGAGSRFCPDCLAESNGRWQLSWRLGWSFACVRHRRLLADLCPRCNARQRRRRHSTAFVPVPGHCAQTAPAAQRRAHRDPCGHPLHDTDTLLLPDGHPTLLAQQHLIDAIHNSVGSFGVYAETAQPVANVLADVRAIGARVLRQMPPHRMRRLVPHDIVDAHLHTIERAIERIGKRATEQVAPGQAGAAGAAPAHATSAALAVTAAWSILSQPDCHAAGARMRELLGAIGDSGTYTAPTLVRAWGQRISPRLESVHLAALATSMRPTDQLRYRTATPCPAGPTSSLDQVAIRAGKIPGLMWPYWAARLGPAHLPRHLRAALPVALLVVGSRIELPQAIAHLGGLLDQPITTHVLQALRDESAWHDVQLALIRLAAHLDQHQPPIDYARRRRLDYTALLPERQWLDLCNRLLVPAGAGTRHRIARCLLFERISGAPHTRLAGAPAARTAFRNGLSRFALVQHRGLRDELDHVGQAFLAEQGIHDEPLTWQPPTELLTGLTLPGSDPALLDVTDIHHRLNAGQTLQRIAEAHGVTVPVLRYLLDRHPLPTPTPFPDAGDARSRGRAGLAHARTMMDKDHLEHLHLQQNLPFVAIAEKTGINRKVLAALAVEYGLPPRRPVSGGTTQRAWLHEQLIKERRTLTDVANELGIAPATLSRRARHHEIPTRDRASLPRPASHFSSAPKIIRAVLTAPGGPRRLTTFIGVADHTTLTNACAALGLPAPTVTTQIQELEGQLGGQLLIRATRFQPMRLTAFGQAVLAAASSVPHLLHPGARDDEVPARTTTTSRSPADRPEMTPRG